MVVPVFNLSIKEAEAGRSNLNFLLFSRKVKDCVYNNSYLTFGFPKNVYNLDFYSSYPAHTYPFISLLFVRA